jgi:hypothetical protein
VFRVYSARTVRTTYYSKFRTVSSLNTRLFKYDRDYLCVNKSQFVPVIFEPPCIFNSVDLHKDWSPPCGRSRSVVLYKLYCRFGATYCLKSVRIVRLHDIFQKPELSDTRLAQARQPFLIFVSSWDTSSDRSPCDLNPLGQRFLKIYVLLSPPVCVLFVESEEWKHGRPANYRTDLRCRMTH